jgi:hypothetical protein
LDCDKEDDVAEGKTQPECFILMPIGNETTPSRSVVSVLLSEIIRPVLGEMGFSDSIPELPSSGAISPQTIGHLLNDKLVIADLTGLDPNVMYEVGIRHCTRLPLVILAEKGTKLPFEIHAEGILLYDNDLAESEDLRLCLKQMCEKAVVDQAPDNPVYRVAELDITKGAAEEDGAPRHAGGSPELIGLRRPRFPNPRKHRIPPAPPVSPDEVVIDWIEAEGDRAAIRNLTDQIGSMGFILAARVFSVGENRTRIEFRHPKKTPSTYIVMKYLTREGFKVTDASVQSEPFTPESSTE